uniref:Uncharacterized protein n=1 Tax=Colletotrichum scovillei TaxID=1209932 RepID=A0A9P7QYA8_9PEZI
MIIAYCHDIKLNPQLLLIQRRGLYHAHRDQVPRFHE